MRKNGSVNSIGLELGSFPLIEMTGNRRITVEGSTGVLLYENDCVKVNTVSTVISINGRGLCLRCISPSCVEVEGFIAQIDFLT